MKEEAAPGPLLKAVVVALFAASPMNVELLRLLPWRDTRFDRLPTLKLLFLYILVAAIHSAALLGVELSLMLTLQEEGQTVPSFVMLAIGISGIGLCVRVLRAMCLPWCDFLCGPDSLHEDSADNEKLNWLTRQLVGREFKIAGRGKIAMRRVKPRMKHDDEEDKDRDAHAREMASWSDRVSERKEVWSKAQTAYNLGAVNAMIEAASNVMLTPEQRAASTSSRLGLPSGRSSHEEIDPEALEKRAAAAAPRLTLERALRCTGYGFTE